jgi:hypothetical protein
MHQRRIQRVERGPIAFALLLASLLAAPASGTSPTDRQASSPEGAVSLEPRIPFEGLSLEGFQGVDSIASQLRALDATSVEQEAWALDMAVSGPGRMTRGTGSKLAGDATVPVPLNAMVGSTVSGIDVSAGIDADPGTIQSGPAKWIGGVKVATEGSYGRAELAVRTSMRYAEQTRLIGVELGPRFERAFPGGLTFFVDGKAQAETAGSPEQRIWAPAASSFDGLGSLGVVGRTGIVR